ncbi:MAG TPA: hypothetical protein VKB15_00295, partial [Xanthobacteraceae bacterium]|nr:hypothetical protein [Xanthobacteraceae bacterium]
APIDLVISAGAGVHGLPPGSVSADCETAPCICKQHPFGTGIWMLTHVATKARRTWASTSAGPGNLRFDLDHFSDPFKTVMASATTNPVEPRQSASRA